MNKFGSLYQVGVAIACRIAIPTSHAIQKKGTELMPLQAIESSLIYAIGYEEANERLTIVFHNSKIYQFFRVPKTVYETLMITESKSSYIQQTVISSYPYAQVLRRKRKRHR